MNVAAGFSYVIFIIVLETYKILWFFIMLLYMTYIEIPRITQEDLTLTCIELVASVFQPEEVVYHGGFADAPRSQEQHHWLGGDFSICGQRELEIEVN